MSEKYTMIKFILLIRILLTTSISYSFEIDKNDIEAYPQSSFPAIAIEINDQSLSYYGMDSSQEQKLRYAEQSTRLKGEIPLSGYIFAKEFVESFKFPNTIGNKKSRSEFLRIFSEKNPGKLVDFILSVNEKKRTAENAQEIELLQQLIEKEQTSDDPNTTAFFSTGYIELKSPEDNNERYFIKISDVNKKTMTLNSNKTHINILKSVTVYSFQNILSSLNFGDIERDSPEDKLYKRLETLNLSICSFDCPLNFTRDLSEMALNVGKIVSFEVVGNSKIENMDDFNKYVFAQQWCVLNNFSKACHVPKLDDEIKNLSQNKIILELIQRHNGHDELCKFIQK